MSIDIQLFFFLIIKFKIKFKDIARCHEENNLLATSYLGTTKMKKKQLINGHIHPNKLF